MTRVMQNHYPESISPRSPRPDLYHGFNICLHIAVCVISDCFHYASSALKKVCNNRFIFKSFLTLKADSNGVSMILLYLVAISLPLVSSCLH